ncbi:MAG TPA: hypothetical protein VF596_07755 [Pyrinomonadaceae bacterium]|jgi:hypothetical protein
MPRRKRQNKPNSTTALTRQNQGGKISDCLNFDEYNARRGRPPKEINTELFVELCKIQCTKLEIMQVLDVSEPTLDKFCHSEFETNFAGAFERFRAGGKISLRHKQFQKAMSGDVKMLVWLGKQYLNQINNPILIQEDKETVIRVVREESDFPEDEFDDNAEYGDGADETGDDSDGDTADFGDDDADGDDD